MRTTGTRSLILYLLTGGFLAGLALLLLSFFASGGKWALQPYNKHLNGNTSISSYGKIIDRNGEVLAKSENGARLYHPDEMTRRAVLQTVGDSRGYISTGVQYNYRAELSGYNPFTGVTSPIGKPAGGNVELTLDAALCKTALQKMNGHDGAALLYNYETGEILCMVSSPGYDPQNPPKDLDTNEKYNGVYLNKALSGLFVPGSIFKIVTADAAAENIADIDSRDFQCKGSVNIGGNVINCTAKHGKIDFCTGLAKSCNVVFAELAVELGEEKMTAAAKKMGFGQSFSINGLPTAKSVYNLAGADDTALAWSGVGQDKDLVNPMHMAMLMGSIAQGGSAAAPYFIKHITTGFGLTTQSGSAVEGPQLVNPATAVRLREYMRNNVTSEYGEKLFAGMNVCAKTGTAEVGGGKKPTGWMVGFSMNDKTPFAFAAAVEEGKSGIGSAGALASAIIKQAAG